MLWVFLMTLAYSRYRYAELVADDSTVRVLDGTTEVARHARSQGRDQGIDDLAHRRELAVQRRAANAAPVRHHLLVEVPELGILFERWVMRARKSA